MGHVRIGTCSWADRTMIEAWYPPEVSSAEARLRYYAARFDTVEADSPYYGIPTRYGDARTGRARTPEGFVFHVKAYGLMTGHCGRRTFAAARGARGLSLRRLSARAGLRPRGRDARRGLRVVPRRGGAAARGRQARRGADAVPAVVPRRGRRRARGGPAPDRARPRAAGRRSHDGRVPPRSAGSRTPDASASCASSPRRASRSWRSTRRRMPVPIRPRSPRSPR